MRRRERCWTTIVVDYIHQTTSEESSVSLCCSATIHTPERLRALMRLLGPGLRCGANTALGLAGSLNLDGSSRCGFQPQAHLSGYSMAANLEATKPNPEVRTSATIPTSRFAIGRGFARRRRSKRRLFLIYHISVGGRSCRYFQNPLHGLTMSRPMKHTG